MQYISLQDIKVALIRARLRILTGHLIETTLEPTTISESAFVARTTTLIINTRYKCSGSIPNSLTALQNVLFCYKSFCLDFFHNGIHRSCLYQYHSGSIPLHVWQGQKNDQLLASNKQINSGMAIYLVSIGIHKLNIVSIVLQLHETCDIRRIDGTRLIFKAAQALLIRS
jgi:hypothetical protein